MDNKKTIGQRINSALALSGKMQKELAAALGVTDNTVSYYVGGKRVPSTEQLIVISKYLGVSTDYLLGLSDTPSPDIEDQAICKKLGIEGETLEALKEIFNSNKKDQLLVEHIPTPSDDIIKIIKGVHVETGKVFSMFIESTIFDTEENGSYGFLTALYKFAEACKKTNEVAEDYDLTMKQFADLVQNSNTKRNEISSIIESEKQCRAKRERYEDELHAAEWRVQKGLINILDIIAERITMPDEWQERKEGR